MVFGYGFVKFFAHYLLWCTPNIVVRRRKRQGSRIRMFGMRKRSADKGLKGYQQAMVASRQRDVDGGGAKESSIVPATEP